MQALHQIIEHHQAVRHDETAFVDVGCTTSFRALAATMGRLARPLAASGVGRGDGLA
jgi:non-ribosomal peptide synthetase component F